LQGDVAVHAAVKEVLVRRDTAAALHEAVPAAALRRPKAELGSRVVTAVIRGRKAEDAVPRSGGRHGAVQAIRAAGSTRRRR
jgi:hypothetical protein